MGNRLKDLRYEILDAAFLVLIAVFAGWAAWTQPPSISAPTMGISTATFLFPRVRTKGEQEGAVEQLHPLMIAIGTALTGFLWLLSTMEPNSIPAPIDSSHVWIILIGWMMTMGHVAMSPFVIVETKWNFRKEHSCATRPKVVDYAVGIGASIATHALAAFVLKLGIDTFDIGPVDNLWLLIVYAAISAPLLGWVQVFAARGRLSRQRGEPREDQPAEE